MNIQNQVDPIETQSSKMKYEPQSKKHHSLNNKQIAYLAARIQGKSK